MQFNCEQDESDLIRIGGFTKTSNNHASRNEDVFKGGKKFSEEQKIIEVTRGFTSVS